jgi:hypothetical protein
LESIKEAKEYLRKNWEKGCKCKVCGQFVKKYKRKLNSSMAITLIRINNNSDDFFHVKDFLRQNKFTNSHDWTLLNHWGFLEEHIEKNGFWRITSLGKDFIKNRIKTKKHIYLYNNIFLGFSDEETTIKESLGDKFNYDELMKGL